MAVESDLMSQIYSRLLKKAGYHPIIYDNGRDAINYIKTNQDISAVITEYFLPFASGLEVIHQARNINDLQVPIILISFITDERTIINSFKMGADAYVTKPLSPRVLMAKLERLFVLYNK